MTHATLSNPNVTKPTIGTRDLSLSVDPCACPLCGQPNQCANEVERATGLPQDPCWCTTVAFDPALLERVPPQARKLACICAGCCAAAQTK